jgi:SAM-dependent methyltransferase
MSHEFDKGYWQQHWNDTHPAGGMPPHPALDTELSGHGPGTALDAGAGEGAEAAWLASRGWNVTAVDISSEALRRASERFSTVASSVTWVEADLTVWQPPRPFDLVTTFYAHPTIPQLAFYERISRWVAPSGTLLIVGHHHAHGHAERHGHPQSAVTGPELIRELLDPAAWQVETAEVRERSVATPAGHATTLHDVVFRARRG